MNRSDSSLFAPTPNNSAIFDFTLSEDDELVSGLPRLGKGDAKTGKKPTMRNAILAGLEKGRVGMCALLIPLLNMTRIVKALVKVAPGRSRTFVYEVTLGDDLEAGIVDSDM